MTDSKMVAMVAEWPLPTSDQVRLLRDLMPPPSPDDFIRALANTLPAGSTHRSRVEVLLAEEWQITKAPRARRVRRKDPADIALEVLARKIDGLRSGRPDAPTREMSRVVDDARRIADDLGIPLAEALAQAKAGAEFRKMGAIRRARHESDHMWCVAPECDIAAGREPS